MPIGTAKDLYGQLKALELIVADPYSTKEVFYPGYSGTGGKIENDVGDVIHIAAQEEYSRWQDHIKGHDPDYPEDEDLTYGDWALSESRTDAGKKTAEYIYKELAGHPGSALNIQQVVYAGCNVESMSKLLNVSPAPETWEALMLADPPLPDADFINVTQWRDANPVNATDESAVWTDRGGVAHGWNPCIVEGYSEAAFKNYVKLSMAVAFEEAMNAALNLVAKEEAVGSEVGYSILAGDGVPAGMTFADALAAAGGALAATYELATGDPPDERFLEEMNQRSAEQLAISIFGNVKYKEQCFLLANLQELAAIKMLTEVSPDQGLDNLGRKTTPDMDMFLNASVQVHGDPFGLINTLTQPPHKENFFEMPTQAISALQPMIRLFKVNSDVIRNRKSG